MSDELKLDAESFLTAYQNRKKNKGGRPKNLNPQPDKREREYAAKREARRIEREAQEKRHWDLFHGTPEIITGLTKDEFTPQVYDPAIHKPLVQQYVEPPKPIHKNKEQKRLEKRQAKALEREAKELAKPKKPTQQELWDAKWKQPAPREV